VPALPVLEYRPLVIRTVKRLARSVVHGEIVLWPAVVAGIGAGVLSVAIGSVRLDLNVEVALASMATFLFGVLLAFTIARTRERLAMVRELMAGAIRRSSRSTRCWRPSTSRDGRTSASWWTTS